MSGSLKSEEWNINGVKYIAEFVELRRDTRYGGGNVIWKLTGRFSSGSRNVDAGRSPSKAAAMIAIRKTLQQQGQERKSDRYSSVGDAKFAHLESLSTMALRGMIRRSGQNPDDYRDNRNAMIEELMFLEFGE